MYPLVSSKLTLSPSGSMALTSMTVPVIFSLTCTVSSDVKFGGSFTGITFIITVAGELMKSLSLTVYVKRSTPLKLLFGT